MKRTLLSMLVAVPLALLPGAAAFAQAAPPQQQGTPGPRGFNRGPRALGGMFEFERMIGGFGGPVVENEPFSADVTRETIELLPDGNRIDRKSTGTIARDSAGRTRQDLNLPDIGPLAALGAPPHLVFIRDSVAKKLYILNDQKKTALVTDLWTRRQLGESLQNGPAGGGIRGQRREEIQQETKTVSLGTKTMNGLTVQGTRVTRTIPAGQIGNEKPIIITTEEWVSPELHMTISFTRNDPRFGSTTYQLTNISREEPPQSLFVVPQDYTVAPQGAPRRNPRTNQMPPPGRE